MEFYDENLKNELMEGFEKYIYDSNGNCFHKSCVWEKGKCLCRICGKDVTPSREWLGLPPLKQD